jgi:MarR family transcriptional regulator, lower aerobic nicotinate degradation pathway regulator
VTSEEQPGDQQGDDQRPDGGRWEVAPPERLWRTPTWLVGHLAGDAHRIIVEAISAAGRTDYAVLAGLAEAGPLSQADLGRRLGIDRSDISLVLDRLETDRLVTRSPDPAHRSRKLVQITPSGRRRLRRLDTDVGQAQDALLAPLDAAEADQFVALLQRLVQHHRGFQHSQGQPPR